MKALQHYWYHSSPVLWLLLPLSWLFCGLVFIRRRLYQLNIIEHREWKTPVVVVGNIVAGGSGKTPLLIALCDYLKGRGLKPGVVSRGYGGSVQGVRQLQAADPAALVGDEPLMIYQRCGVPVVVGADRPAAVDCLLNNNDCDIVLSDDGLQHYRMGRCCEIAVIDSERRFGNGFCLPAGPLREPVSRLEQVDLAVFNGVAGDKAEKNDNELFYTLEASRLYHLNDSRRQVTFDYFRNKTVHAVAGTANPARFFAWLRAQGLTIIEHAFADHYRYAMDDFSGWSSECIIMTEKDAVKCRQLGHQSGRQPDTALELADAWVMGVNAVFSPALKQAVDTQLLTLSAATSKQ